VLLLTSKTSLLALHAARVSALYYEHLLMTVKSYLRYCCYYSHYLGGLCDNSCSSWWSAPGAVLPAVPTCPKLCWASKQRMGMHGKMVGGTEQAVGKNDSNSIPALSTQCLPQAFLHLSSHTLPTDLPACLFSYATVTTINFCQLQHLLPGIFSPACASGHMPCGAPTFSWFFLPA